MKALESDRAFRVCLGAGFLAALAIRLAWIAWIQHPADALYADMAHYIFRARQLFTGEPDPLDMYPSCMPFGAHYLYAFEMLFFGLEGLGAMAVVNAIVSAFVTPLSMLVARDAFRSPLGYLLVGAASVIWHPHLVFVGFFTSELPYNTLLVLSLLLWSRWIRTGQGSFLAGLVPALAFTIRPPMILTILLGLVWLLARHRRLPWLSFRKVAALATPVVLVVSFSAIRHRIDTGDWALISGSGVVTRFFADTEYRSIVTPQTGPDGKERLIGIFPPARVNYQGDFVFRGRRCDARVLEPARKAFLRTKGPLYRFYLVRRNILLLFVDNSLFPEHVEAKPSTRKRAILLRWWGLGIAFIVAPLSYLGMITLIRRYNPTLELATLHILTCLYSAAMHSGEIRYRIPYDPVLLLLAVQGLLVAFRLEPPGERQDRWASVVLGISLVLFAVLMIVSWPSSGSLR